MAKKRVHEIAKERGITSKEALEVLRAAGLEVKVAASSVEEADAARAFGNGAVASAPAAEPAAPAAPAETSEAPEAEAAPVPTPAEGDGGKPRRGGQARKGAAQREGGPPQARPGIQPPAGEPVRRAGPEGRGPRILQDAPPPQPERPQQNDRPAAAGKGADGAATGGGQGADGPRPARGGRGEAGGQGGRRRRVVIDSQA
ncbi:MAG TPA: translation initiation factor IF-2 N-terminal domain-containing protein, partial [Solirubrobacterales bacterium]|nr:translation initiation factor IF-2 N-terminal domain-containing protein [Solirubrobacterales bacterium]